MAKGSSFERELCKKLTKWWTGDEDRDVIFWRTSQSGGRATFRSRQGKKTSKAHCGDLVAIEKIGKPLTDLITIEVKRGYNKAVANDIIDKPHRARQQTLEGFLEQTVNAADAKGTPYWMLIHKRDKRYPVVYMPIDLFGRLDDLGCFKNVAGLTIASPVKTLSGRKLFIHAVAISLDDFCRYVDRQDIRAIVRQLRA